MMAPPVNGVDVVVDELQGHAGVVLGLRDVPAAQREVRRVPGGAAAAAAASRARVASPRIAAIACRASSAWSVMTSVRTHRW